LFKFASAIFLKR